MQSIQQQLTALFAEAFETLELSPESASVVVSQRPEMSHYQCNGALREAKMKQVPPRELAEKIMTTVLAIPEAPKLIDTLTVEGPGFLNIRVQSAVLQQQVSAMAHDERFGIDVVEKPQKITIDYGGLNVAKPMHVGHLRSLMIGESMKRVLRFLGHEVTADVHLGDWGTQMGMIITELRREQPHLPYFDDAVMGDYPTEPPFTLDDLDRIYPQASARCKEDPEAMAEALGATRELQVGRPGYYALWQHIVHVSVSQLKEDVAFLGVDFDLWNGESDYHEWCITVIDRLKKTGEAQESNGALIVPLPEEDGKRELPPLLLTKSDGAFLYGTTDLGCLVQRIEELHQDWLMYVVDARQSLHFEQVFRAAGRTGLAPASVRLQHVGFGTMNGSDGKPFKTRSGGSMKLGDLVRMAIDAADAQMQKVNVGGNYTEEERRDIARLVGLAALKYADLMNHHASSYIFDIDKFTQFEGKTGPYLLYAAVRMQSIITKAQELGIMPAKVIQADRYETPEGQNAIRALKLHMLKFPEILDVVARDAAPHILAEYVYELSQHFHHFYSVCPILNAEQTTQQQELVGLVVATRRLHIFALSLLGIEVPERM